MIFIFFVVLLEFCKIDYIIKFEINISLYLYQSMFSNHILHTFYYNIQASQLSVQSVRKFRLTVSIAQVSEAGSVLRHSPIATHDSDSWLRSHRSLLQ